MEFPDGQNDMINVLRLIESNPVHPCLSKNGLHALAMMEVGRWTTTQIIMIRIVRDPIEIFESFYSKRVEGSPVYMRGVNEDERIFDFIITERTNTRIQKERYVEFRTEWDERGKRGWPFRLIEVQYEALDTNLGKVSFSDKIDAHVPGLGADVRMYLEDTWKKKPIRHGRLSQGITESLLTTELKEEIRCRCESL
jgi:hypothetical protein